MYLSPSRNREMAEKMFRHVRDGTTDMDDETFAYDLKIYSDPEIAREERRRIFGRLPVMALHASQLPEPGSFVTVQMCTSNVLTTRGRDGRVRAFLNACRHRGARVVTAESGAQVRFACPYHGWTYNGKGELKTVSFQRTVGIAPCAELNLVELPCEERHGFIWIVENPQASIDVAAHLGPEMDAALGEYRFGDWHVHRQRIFDFPQNWKIMLDGLIDGYHVQWVHGETIRPYFYMNMSGRIGIAGDHVIVGTPRKAIDKILHEEPGESAIDRYVVVGNTFMPNTTFVLHPHHIEYWTIYPDPKDPGRSRTHLRYLTHDREHDAKATEILDKNWEIASAAIINEDVPTGNSVQASSESDYAGKVILGRNEIVNQLFHRNYARYMAE